MANAKKCDRCGGFYDDYEGIKVLDNSKLRANRIDIVGTINYQKIDLCSNCMEAFKSFMTNGGTDNGEELQ